MAELEPAAPGKSVVQDVLIDGGRCAEVFGRYALTNVLDLAAIFVAVDDDARDHLRAPLHRVQSDKVREARGQAFDLLGRMDGLGAMAAPQVGRAHLHEGVKVVVARHREARSQEALHVLPAVHAEGRAVPDPHGACDLGIDDAAAEPGERVDILFRGQRVVEKGHRLVDERFDPMRSHVALQRRHDREGLAASDIPMHDQASIGQALMRVEGGTDAIGRQAAERCAVHEEHETVIQESIAVILHVIAEEEEVAVLCLRDEGIPLLLHRRFVEPSVCAHRRTDHGRRTCSRCLMTRAGTPATTTFGSMSRSTTAPAPT